MYRSRILHLAKIFLLASSLIIVTFTPNVYAAPASYASTTSNAPGAAGSTTSNAPGAAGSTTSNAPGAAGSTTSHTPGAAGSTTDRLKATSEIFNCGGSCVGVDPYVYNNGQRCFDGAFIAVRSDISIDGNAVGSLENWYSPNCNTNWAQITWSGGANYAVAADIYDGVGTCKTWDGLDCEFYPRDNYVGGVPPVWTYMVDGSNLTTANGYMQDQNTSHTGGASASS